MKASFNKNNFEDFMKKLVIGKESFAPFSEMPKIKTVSEWDGFDGKKSNSKSNEDL